MPDAKSSPNFHARLLALLHEAGMAWADVPKGTTIQQMVQQYEKRCALSTPEPRRSSAPPRRPSHHALQAKK